MLTIEAVLEGGLDALLNPAAARRRALVQLPEIVARSLLGQMAPATREGLAARLTNELWPAVRSERGERWDRGWAELTAGVALAIELLQGELPRALQAELQGTPAEQAWRVARRPFQRFVLLLDSSVHVRRVFASPRSRPPAVPVEQSQEWTVDGPRFRDRSHTLMLALMADGALSEDTGPTAATGELLDDGERVGPVGGLVEKAVRWRQLHPQGLLISAPPRDPDARKWASLACLPTSSSGNREPNWVVGATLCEIKAKLAPAQLSIETWDGTPLAENAVLEPRLATHDVAPPEQPFGDALMDATWAASRDARSGGPRRGVVIHGSPGSGKSVLTKTLERRFSRGALGAFGFGIRRSARELAADLARASSRSWSAVLALRDPTHAELFGALEATQRLVPIVDGLDELQPQQLEAISHWLRTGSGWWIATSRPLRGIGAELPLAWGLRLQDLRRDDARRLLVALGREDLADAADNQTATVRELTRTPLHTALLARVVLPGQDPLHLQPHALYERAFEALLDHSSRSGRLTTADAGLLKHLLSTVIGELAIAWLKSEEGLLDRAALDRAFDQSNLGPIEQVRVIEALTFGHLLLPVGAAWEFGHRTMAEWVAAAALRRRVESGMRADPESPVELDVLGPFLEDGGRWATLLKFYAPFVKEPTALLDRLLGPADVTSRRVPERRSTGPVLRRATSTEVLASWSFAYDILGMCRWTRAAEARAAWAMAVRRWLLPVFERRHVASEGLASLRGFSEAIAAHLPETLDDLVSLAARTEAQRSQLTSDPLLLLPAIPAASAPALADLLEHGTRAQQLAVLEWHTERGVEPPPAVLDRVARDVPSELEHAARARDARPKWETSSRAPDDAYVLARLEAAVWSTFLGRGGEPPWAVVRRRFAAWPEHLNEQLTTLFGRVPELPSTRDDDACRRRRELLASQLDQAASAEKDIAGSLASIADASGRARVIGRLRYFFDDGDERQLQRTVEDITARQGWTDGKAGSLEWSEIDQEPVAAALRQTVTQLSSTRTRIARLIGVLDEPALDRIVGELWVLLAPEHAGRREILLALDGREHVPEKIAVAEIVRHLGGAGWHLDRIRWTAQQLEQLRELSRTGASLERFAAARALARATGRDEVTELLQHLPTEDEAFTSLVYEHVTRMGEAGAAALAVPDPSRLPLADRAARNVPGWRAELLARLAGDEDATTLAEVATRHEAREALPFLARKLSSNEWRDRPIVEAIALLVTDRDEEIGRTALRHALRFGWPDGRPRWSPLPPGSARDTSTAGAALACFLRIDDLDVLAEGEVSALRHPPLAAAIRALGPAAIDRLLALHDAGRRRVGELEVSSRAAGDAATPEPELEQGRTHRDSLAETIVASLDPSAASPAYVVDLLVRIAGEDIHLVMGVPGPLGSDFDEPGDQDWHSSQQNEALVMEAARVLEESLRRCPSDWRALRRLFGHPSESLRKRAFELCADRAPPHEVAALALEALDGHDRESRTRWTGQTAGLLLAGHQSGAGSVYVHSPDTGRSLVAAVRARLTQAHKDVLQRLTVHPLPVFRRLAAQWAGELGSEDWVELVVPLLDDEEPGVVCTAIGAVAALAPSLLDTKLAGLRCAVWTPAHDVALLSLLRPTLAPLPLLQTDRVEHDNIAAHVAEPTLIRILSGAAGRAAGAAGSEQAPREASCFRGFPSLVETVLSAWPHPVGPEIDDLFRAWTHHPKQLVREVGRRRLAVRGLLDLSLVESLLVSKTAADRFSGAECVVRMRLESHRAQALSVFRGALAESPDENDFRAIALEPPTGNAFAVGSLRSDALGDPSELRRRLLWALRGATPAFAAALEFVANWLPFNDAEGCLEPEAEEIVQAVIGLTRRWGPQGAVALLALIERGAVEGDYTFLSEIRRAAERHADVLAAVRAGVAQGGAASASVLKDLNDGEFDRDLEGLARRLMEDVFPPGWQGHSA